MKLGCVSYINTLPFRLALKHASSIQLVLDVPSRLAQGLLSRSIDMALTSSVLTFVEGMHYVPQFGIAAEQHIMSVSCYTKPSLFQTINPTIGVLSDSRTSIQLLRVIAKYLWCIPTPTLIPIQSDQFSYDHPYDAVLLIGDLALHHPSIPMHTTHDLAACWYELTRTPFIFALFSYFPTVCSDTMACSFVEHLPQKQETWNPYLSAAIPLAAQQTTLPIDQLEKYFYTCQYLLSAKHFQGMQQFQKYCHELTVSSSN